MAVAHDAVTESATFTTTSPHTFSHDPTGTPRGVLVLIGHGSSTDLINGAVTYDGEALTRVGTIADLAGEPGRVYAYFLGTGVNTTDPATVSISHTGSADVKWAACVTVTASADTEVGSTASAQQASPGTITPSTSQPVLYKTVAGLAYQIIYNGAVVSNLTLVGGWTDLNVEHDYASASLRVDGETSVSGPSVLAGGYTQSVADDLAIIGLNIQEVGSGAYVQGANAWGNQVGTTGVVLPMQGDLAGKDMYVHVVSRDSTSASADVTCTDDSGVGSWLAVSTDADKKAWVFWKRGTQSDVGALITIGAAVGSCVAGMFWTKGTDGAAGNPTTNLTVETNASGNETHAEIDPTNDNSIAVFSIHDYGNDTNAATVISGATIGSMEPELYERFSTGGSDSRLTVAAKLVASGATGAVTWSQTDSTTKSILYAIRPVVVAATTRRAPPRDRRLVRM